MSERDRKFAATIVELQNSVHKHYQEEHDTAVAEAASQLQELTANFPYYGGKFDVYENDDVASVDLRLDERLNWARDRWGPDYSTHYEVAPEPFAIDSFANWRWPHDHYTAVHYFFKDKESATLFKLTWSGDPIPAP